MGLSRIKNKEQLYRLRSGCRVWNERNTEPDIGKCFVIHSPFTNTDYKNCITEYTDWQIIEKYISDGNLYVEVPE